ncbi:hypothetical protein GXP67_10375 [Rhodocytophaga rosea]|uniref:Uncharacterized protein n=1 Tax=Rhodocytophaga rosea TaxID=2704465 RepID=A0A6C0GH33_9BACT|nr:hypothetical protein [Rhodocytophaga rosea]QHT67022.1 hypothetical protein GXP67_10375 [Rhodocytophaga rosea]
MKITTCLGLEKSCYSVGLYSVLDAYASLLRDGDTDNAIRTQPGETQVDGRALHYRYSANLAVFVSYMQTFFTTNISLVLHLLNQIIKSTFDGIGLLSWVSVLSKSKTNLVITGCS